ncbi:hypothetical protein [Rhodococcus sp. KRD197]|uniref:hypothetical protein n=1 Tax=Rhodococcus sp. KRD197 TaxID=2729731 RepID=UPI0019D24BAF|nr:hypothetical protein [Rhodococcus sp. KRD197]
MTNFLRSLDTRTRKFFGGPGLGMVFLVALIAFVLPVVGRGMNLRGELIAALVILVAAVIYAVGRVRRRLASDD